MATVLKSFRLNVEVANYIKHRAQELGISEAKFLEKELSPKLTQEEQWKADLLAIKDDEEYHKEMRAMAEENFSDFIKFYEDEEG